MKNLMGAKQATSSNKYGVTMEPLGLGTAMETVGNAGETERGRNSNSLSIDSSDQSRSSAFNSARDGILDMSMSGGSMHTAAAAAADCLNMSGLSGQWDKKLSIPAAL